MKIIKQKQETKEDDRQRKLLMSINVLSKKKEETEVIVNEKLNEIKKLEINIKSIEDHTNNSIASLNEIKQSIESSISKLKQEVGGLVKECVIKKQEIDSLNNDLINLQKTIECKEEEIENLKSNNENQVLIFDKSLIKNRKTLEDIKISIKNANLNLAEKQEYAEKLDKQAIEKDKKLEALDKSIFDKKQTIDILNKEIDLANEKLKEAKKNLQDFEVKNKDLNTKIFENLGIITKQDQEILTQQETMVALVKRENRVDALAAKVRELYMKAGITITL